MTRPVESVLSQLVVKNNKSAAKQRRLEGCEAHVQPGDLLNVSSTSALCRHLSISMLKKDCSLTRVIGLAAQVRRYLRASTDTSAVTTKLLKHTRSRPQHNHLDLLSTITWCNDSVKAEETNSTAQLGAKWLPGGPYFICTNPDGFHKGESRQAARRSAFIAP